MQYSVEQQTPFITSPAPGAPDSETDNVPYLSPESRWGRLGVMIPVSAISNWKRQCPYCEQTAPGICIGNFTKCSSGTLWDAPQSVKDTGDTHHGLQAVQAWTLLLTP